MGAFLQRIDARRLDVSTWPTVNDAQLEGDSVLRYRRKRDAILHYLEHRDLKVACELGGISADSLYRLVRRCTSDHGDGRLVGFRACLPYFRIAKYVRRAPGAGTAGLLSQLFRENPRIEEAMRDFALRRGNRLAFPARVGLTDLRNHLLQLCREAGFTATMYPLNAAEGGIRSLARWRQQLLDAHGRAFVKEKFGADAARNFDGGWGAATTSIDPYTIWVFDEYTIDTFVTIGVPQRNGSKKWLPMARFKVISGRRRGSKDIVVCRAVLKMEPNALDFLEALEASIRPHQRMEFTVPGFQYPPRSCFSSELDGCAWALPSLVMLDNSKAHLSEGNRRAITERLGCAVQFGIVGRPKARGDIESWHSYLAREFRKLASTTGTGPRDTRRVEPEAASVALRLEVEHINQLLEMLVARFNTNPLNSLKGRSPIEAFENWVRDDNLVLRQLPVGLREGFALAEKQVVVRIACDVASGRMPLVRYQYADYMGPRLSAMRSRAGEECILVVNPTEAHLAKLYAKDGSEIDTLRARGIWHAPHSLDARVNFVAKRKRGEVMHPTEGRTPTEVLRDSLVSSAPANKREALALARLEKEAKVPTEDSEVPAVPAPKRRQRVVNKMKASGDW